MLRGAKQKDPSPWRRRISRHNTARGNRSLRKGEDGGYTPRHRTLLSIYQVYATKKKQTSTTQKTNCGVRSSRQVLAVAPAHFPAAIITKAQSVVLLSPDLSQRTDFFCTISRAAPATGPRRGKLTILYHAVASRTPRETRLTST